MHVTAVVSPPGLSAGSAVLAAGRMMDPAEPLSPAL